MIDYLLFIMDFVRLISNPKGFTLEVYNFGE
jgi:hypothetical protein